MDNNIVAYQVGPNTKINQELIKLTGFNNIDYLGHTKDSNIPVYINKFLKQGETKVIMKDQEYTKLEPGAYKATVRQIINKDKDGKATTSIELDVEGVSSVKGKFEYLTLFRKGYNEASMEISQKSEDKMLEMFGINALEQLVNQKVDLVVKQNNKGYINYFIYPPKKFMEWTTDCVLPCTITKVYETKDGNKYCVAVDIEFAGQKFNDYVVFDKNSKYEWVMEGFNYLLKKANLTEADFGKPLNISAQFKVTINQSKKDPTKHFVNKKIVWKK